MQVLIIYVAAILCVAVQAGRSGIKPIIFSGASDASAAVLVDSNTIAVADDEDNLIRLYRPDGGQPIAKFDMSGFLDVETRFPEADIEGAARVKDRIYWISSHGRNKDGKLRPSRYRFFATTIVHNGKGIVLKPEGRPYKGLVEAMLRARHLSGLGLEEAAGSDIVAQLTRSNDRKRLAPKDEGINIEGLSTLQEGQLIIGFRNPIPKKKALIIPLLNPEKVIMATEDPQFGRPILLDLDGLGIRDIHFLSPEGPYYIIAGPSDESRRFVLYSWSGRADHRPTKVMDLQIALPDWTPECLVFTGIDTALLLSDDGSRLVKVEGPHQCKKGQYLPKGLCPNKALLDPQSKTFRGISLVLR